MVVGLMGPLLNVFHVLSPYYEYHSISRKGGLNSPLNCFWYVYGALLQQGKLTKIFMYLQVGMFVLTVTPNSK